MASSSLLFLLLVMCPGLVFTGKLSDFKTGTKVLKYFSDNINEIKEVANSFLELIEKTGPIAKAVVNLFVFIVNGELKEDKVLQTVTENFQRLNRKIDLYHVQQRWDIWAAAAYHKPEIEIEVAWTSFQTLCRTLIETSDPQMKKRHLKEFFTSYQKYEPASKILHRYLLPKSTVFINNVGSILADHIKCDESDIDLFSKLMEELFFKAFILNNLYYTAKNIHSQAKIDESAQMLYDFTSAVFEIRKYCVTQMNEFVKQEVEDVINQIDPAKSKIDIAENIRIALEKKEDGSNYQWMVVVFKSKKSNHSILKIRNKHTLTGFTVVPKGKVTVAVTRQLKGTYNQAPQVKKVIAECLGPKIHACYKINKILSECQKNVGTVPLSQTYTAIHAFHGNAHESHSDDSNIPSDTISVYDNVEYQISSQSDKDNIYRGECYIFVLLSQKPFKGKFNIIIKSDKEIQNDLCKDVKCGGEDRGQCDSLLRKCQCKYPYYGDFCQNDINNTKLDLKNLPQMDFYTD